ncbi:MAG: hypothetical protein ACE5H3_06050 [Planctomycetota bacterium]
MTRFASHLLLVSLAATAWGLGPSVQAAEAGPEARAAVSDSIDVKIDESKVRYGDVGSFKPKQGQKVGVVRSKEVYLEIPAYQTILKEKIKKGTARYNQLINEATVAFKKALVKVANKGGLALIVEEGGIQGYPTTDVTRGVIRALSR